MITNEIRKSVLTIPMDIVLSDLGVMRGKNRAYFCPYHLDEGKPNGHILSANKSRYGIYLFKCFRCETTKNNIELVMDAKGLTYPQAVDYLLNLNNSASSKVTDVLPSKPPKTSHENYLDAKAKFIPYDETKTRGTHRVVREHLQERGLFNATRHLRNNRYDIGTVDRNVAYRLNNFVIVRYPYNKANYGTPKFSFLNVNALDKTLYICEGITDALALAEMGYNSIVLHSVNNVQALINRFNTSPNSRDNHYIIATDNDKAGLNAKHQLETFFNEQGYSYSDMQELRLSKYKDIGEYYTFTKTPLK